MMQKRANMERLCFICKVAKGDDCFSKNQHAKREAAWHTECVAASKSTLNELSRANFKDTKTKGEFHYKKQKRGKQSINII